MAKKLNETYRLDFTYFRYYPGEKVKPIILNHGLEDKLYTITEFLEPHPPKDLHGVVFLEGHPYGVDAQYIIPEKIE